jgi:hypothetical protein
VVTPFLSVTYVYNRRCHPESDSMCERVKKIDGRSRRTFAVPVVAEDL